MNNSWNLFFCTILFSSLCCVLVASQTDAETSGQIAHYAFRHAEQLLKKNTDEYNPDDPFLESLFFCPNAPVHTYALFCGEAHQSTMLLSKREYKQRAERETLKKIACNIVYLRLNKTENNSFCLGEHSECEKLLNIMKDRRNDYTFCIVFNNPDNESLLHVAQVDQKNTVLSTAFFASKNNRIHKLPAYMAFINQIVTDETKLKSAIRDYFYSHYSTDVARAELDRLSCISFLTRLWGLVSLQSLSLCLQVYIVAMVCYKYFLRGISIVQILEGINALRDIDILSYMNTKTVIISLFVLAMCSG